MQCGVCALCVVVSGVLCVCVSVGVCAWCVVCVVCVARLGTRKTPRVQVPDVSVCRFKSRPSVPAKRAHVFNTCVWFAGTHGSVSNVRTETFGTYTRGASHSLSLSSRPFHLSLFRRSLSLLFLFSLLLSLSNNDNDRSPGRLSLCTHSSDLP